MTEMGFPKMESGSPDLGLGASNVTEAEVRQAKPPIVVSLGQLESRPDCVGLEASLLGKRHVFCWKCNHNTRTNYPIREASQSQFIDIACLGVALGFPHARCDI
jgi:hypothetical protein